MSRPKAFAVLSAMLLLVSAGCSTSSETEAAGARSVGVASEDGGTQQEAPVPSSAAGSSVAPDELPMADGPDVSVVVGHVVDDSITAYKRPDETSTEVTTLNNPTAVGGPLAFRLVDHNPPEGPWVEVFLPVRPNGATGWVRTAELQLSLNPFRIEVDRAAHSLTVFRRGEVWLETTVAIGTGDTPTPVGEFYIIELLKPPSQNGVYGPFAFGLSGFSETLTSFAGGDGVIGIHGTNQPEAIGTDVSHGCIRLANDVISELAGVIPLGTPVRIV